MRYPREALRLGMAALLLHAIKEAPDNFKALGELHRMLLRQIINCERRIKRLKNARQRIRSFLSSKRPAKATATKLKKVLRGIDGRVKDIHHLLFLWRCFGDGIACIYQSTYSLKHLYFDADYQVKSDPGFVLGKEGLIREYRLLRKALQMKVPAVLSDLTNIIRHGDVCLLAQVDPVPIEVKSSSNRNDRVRRQIEQLQVLHEFYTNDGAASFRGLPSKRIAVKSPVVSYEREFNECMTTAYTNGMQIVSPEPGLTYICARTEGQWSSAMLEAVETHSNGSTLCVALTPDPTWLPHYSFTVSLSPANTVSFMQEVVIGVVLIDLAILKDLLVQKNLNPVILMDGVHALQVSWGFGAKDEVLSDPGTGHEMGCEQVRDDMAAGDVADGVVNLHPFSDQGIFRASELHFLRTATQFESLNWFVDGLASQMELIKCERLPTTANPSGGEFYMGVPDGWLEAQDCYVSTSYKS